MIDRHVSYALGFVRRRMRRDQFIRNLDDLRQTAALVSLETVLAGGDLKQAALRLWSEYRCDRGENRRYVIRERWDSVPCERCDGHDPIPDRYFAKCSDRERAALCFAYECDMSRNDIAEVMGVSVKAANLLLVRGRKKVQAVA